MGILQVNAFPCEWPIGWPRTSEFKRRESPYRITCQEAYKRLVRELKLLGAREIVVSTNMQLKRNGEPYASAPEPKDPAIAVYWVEREGPRVIACDQWKRTRENMRAAGLAIAALRQLKRTGASQVIERAFIGLAALPAQNPRRSWREVFGKPATWSPTAEEIRGRYHELAKFRHPDANGSHEQMLELNQAFEQAVSEMGAVWQARS